MSGHIPTYPHVADLRRSATAAQVDWLGGADFGAKCQIGWKTFYSLFNTGDGQRPVVSSGDSSALRLGSGWRDLAPAVVRRRRPHRYLIWLQAC